MRRQFKEFKIEDVLDWQPQIEIDPLKLKDLSIDSNTKYPFYGQATINNGIIGYYSLTERVLNNKNGKPTILVHSNNQNVVYLESPFYLKDGHGATSVLQAEFLNLKSALFIITAIRKAIKTRFTYNAKATKIALKNTYISLPITSNGSIDYKYMEVCISELEEESMNDIETYLKVSGLNDYILTSEEQNALEIFNNGEIIIKEYLLGGMNGLFEIKATKQKFNANKLTFGGKTPYVIRSNENNGIRGYITKGDRFLNEGNTISFGQDTATMFFQKEPYFTGDKIKVFSLKGRVLNRYLGQYFITTMKKSFSTFSWGGNSYNENILKNILISLPTKNNKPDFDFMETYIKAIEKLVIKNIFNWKEEIIYKI